MKKFKIVIDILMLGLFIFLMGYHITSELVHEWLGISLFVLFIIHQSLNHRWYRSLLNRNRSYIKFLYIIINLSLFILLIITIISGVMISKYMFRDLEITYISSFRQIHMLSSSWVYILMSLHLGLHIKVSSFKSGLSFIQKISKIAFFLIYIMGFYAILERNLFSDLFMINDFKYLPYGENIIKFIIDYISITVFFSYIGSLLLQSFIKKMKIIQQEGVQDYNK